MSAQWVTIISSEMGQQNSGGSFPVLPPELGRAIPLLEFTADYICSFCLEYDMGSNELKRLLEAMNTELWIDLDITVKYCGCDMCRLRQSITCLAHVTQFKARKFIFGIMFYSHLLSSREVKAIRYPLVCEIKNPYFSTKYLATTDTFPRL